MDGIHRWHGLALRAIRRPEVPDRRHCHVRHTFSVSSIQVNSISPPFGEKSSGVRDTEEDHDTTQSQTRIKCSCQDVVVFRPPGEVASFDEAVEDIINEGPARIIDTSRWT